MLLIVGLCHVVEARKGKSTRGGEEVKCFIIWQDG